MDGMSSDTQLPPTRLSGILHLANRWPSSSRHRSQPCSSEFKLRIALVADVHWNNSDWRYDKHDFLFLAAYGTICVFSSWCRGRRSCQPCWVWQCSRGLASTTNAVGQVQAYDVTYQLLSQ